VAVEPLAPVRVKPSSRPDEVTGQHVVQRSHVTVAIMQSLIAHK
jgi:hypothetical protein